MSKSLANISKAKKALASAKSFDEVLSIRDQAEAARVYAKAACDGLELQNSAAEIKILAERKAGEMLAAMEKAKPPGKKIGNTMLPNSLADLGITKMQSHRWQKIALIPEEQFLRHISETCDAMKELTSASVHKLLSPKEEKQEEPFCLLKHSDKLIEQLEGTQVDWPEEHWAELARLLIGFAERIKECRE